jgi:hypothetical protein
MGRLLSRGRVAWLVCLVTALFLLYPFLFGNPFSEGQRNVQCQAVAGDQREGMLPGYHAVSYTHHEALADDTAVPRRGSGLFHHVVQQFTANNQEREVKAPAPERELR